MVEITEITSSRDVTEVCHETGDAWGTFVPQGPVTTVRAKSDKPFTLGAQINLGCCGYGGRYKLRGRATVTSAYWDHEPEPISARMFGHTCLAERNPIHGLGYGAELEMHGRGSIELIANG